jgi:hypothetical protein
MHVHRAGDRLQYAFALTRGGGHHGRVTTGGCADLSEFQAPLRDDAEVVCWSVFREKAHWSRRHSIVERNPPA